jgi:hypothetical protein
MKIIKAKHFIIAVSGIMLAMPLSSNAQVDGSTVPAPAPAPVAPVTPVAPAITLQTFYDQLAPYGQWVNYGTYGYVFIPSVAPGFSPYSTAGHWVYNDTYGWMWASDYAWGWAAFHYGRWNYDANYGWFWIPDLNWGPAWVAWRNCEGYYGWAPMPWGVDINVGFASGYGIAAEHWCFVPQEHMCEINLGGFYVARTHNAAFIEHSVIINRMDYDRDHHFGYFKGPDRVEVEKYVNHPVTVVAYDTYRHAPDRKVVVVNNNDVHHDDGGHHDDHKTVVVVQNNGGHDDHSHDAQRQDNHSQDMQRHDDHSQQSMQRTNQAPNHYVQSNELPRRGRR